MPLFRQIKFNKKIASVFLFILGAMGMGIIRAYLQETLVLDDTAYLANFQNIYLENGNIITALLKILLNVDLAYSGDFRTYGISKFIHSIIMLMFGNNCKVYAFLIGFSHVISGYFVYYILNFLYKNGDFVKICTLVYIFSPFMRVQSFHHFTYLLLPFYLLLAFICWELKGLYSNITVFKLIVSMIWVFLIVFTGEHTLPMLFCILLLFALYARKRRWRKRFIKYCCLLIWEVLLFTGWYLFYNTFINQAEVSRFILKGVAIKEGIFEYLLSAIKALKSFLLINWEYTPTVRTSISVNSLDQFSFAIMFAILAACLLIILGIKTKDKYGNVAELATVSRKEMLGKLVCIILFTLSSMLIYVALSIFTQAYSMPTRYFYITFTLLSICLVAILFVVFSERDAKIISVALIIFFIGQNIVWEACLLMETKMDDEEIALFLEEAEERGLQNLVVYNSSAGWNQALTSVNTYRGESAYDWAVTLESWVAEKYNFEKIIFMSEPCESVNEKYIRIYDNEEEICLEKDKVAFIGISNLSNLYGRQARTIRNCYFGYEEFRQSADCWGVNTYSSYVADRNDIGIAQKETLIYVDVGNEGETENDQMPDKEYSEESVGISYGYCSEGLVTSSVSNELYQQTGDLGCQFLTNRYSSVGKMEYKFSGLPEDKMLAVVIDGFEWWQYSSNKRKYDIEIITDTENYWLKDIDTYLLGYTEEALDHKSPYRIMINLADTKEVSIVFYNKEGFDVATLNGIGIVER